MKYGNLINGIPFFEEMMHPSIVDESKGMCGWWVAFSYRKGSGRH